jgi:hypothetical protein
MIRMNRDTSTFAGDANWVAGRYGDQSFAQVVGRDIAAVIAGFSQFTGGVGD